MNESSPCFFFTQGRPLPRNTPYLDFSSWLDQVSCFTHVSHVLQLISTLVSHTYYNWSLGRTRRRGRVIFHPSFSLSRRVFFSKHAMCVFSVFSACACACPGGEISISTTHAGGGGVGWGAQSPIQIVETTPLNRVIDTFRALRLRFAPPTHSVTLTPCPSLPCPLPPSHAYIRDRLAIP